MCTLLLTVEKRKKVLKVRYGMCLQKEIVGWWQMNSLLLDKILSVRSIIRAAVIGMELGSWLIKNLSMNCNLMFPYSGTHYGRMSASHTLSDEGVQVHDCAEVLLLSKWIPKGRIMVSS